MRLPPFAIFLLSVSPLPAAADAAQLWYQAPAKAWSEALPVGNGALTAATIPSANGRPCTVRASTPLPFGANRSRADRGDHVIEFQTISGKTYEILSSR